MKNLVRTILFSFLFTLAGITIASPININEATAEQISDNLVGIGSKKAAAIVRYREQYGHFNNPEELVNVKGIGAETLEKNKVNILTE